MSWRVALILLSLVMLAICIAIEWGVQRKRRKPFIPYSQFPADRIFTPTQKDRTK